ncbi:MAG: AAA family ATPase [Desulfovibrio sp.]|nr:AAA family ATPase [Desulfovibrio sp.]
MKEEQREYFSRLTAKRTKSAETLHDDVAFHGVKDGAVGKYREQAHFLYELLQNADDAGASETRFELEEDRLLFFHNGTRHFNITDPESENEDLAKGQIGDVNAICTIGASAKKDEENTIGKFGVGFKAVFQYTTRPEIYDSEFSFCIENFLVPRVIGHDHGLRRPEETLFIFPFDHPDREAKAAFTDISQKLRSLTFPLLFLNNLQSLHFRIKDKRGAYSKKILEREVVGDCIFEDTELLYEYEGKRETRTLFCYSQKFNDTLRYTVGFFHADGKLYAKAHPAFCYFPTKETTNLNFILHAPFRLTDSREGILAGSGHNKDLIRRLAALAAAALPHIRDLGLRRGCRYIDDDIFTILPYKAPGEDNRDSISFRPFYEKIQEAFASGKDAIIPAQDGYAGPADAIWAAVPELPRVFSNEQLRELSGIATARWVFCSLGRDDIQDRDKELAAHIGGMIRGFLGEDAILKGRRKGQELPVPGITAEFMERQCLDWWHAFYAWLADPRGKNRRELAKRAPVLIDEQGKACIPFDDGDHPQIFLSGDPGDMCRRVLQQLLDRQETARFLQDFGLGEAKPFDRMLLSILPAYREGKSRDFKNDFLLFFDWYKGPKTDAEREEGFEALRDCPFLLAQDDGNLYRPLDLYYPKRHLKDWFSCSGHAKYIDLSVYLTLIGPGEKKLLVKFLGELQVAHYPRLLQRDLSREQALALKTDWTKLAHRQDEHTWREWYLDGMDALLDMAQTAPGASRLLVATLRKLLKEGTLPHGASLAGDVPHLLGGVHTYVYHKERTEFFEASQSRKLRTLPWMENGNGGFVTPAALGSDGIKKVYRTELAGRYQLCRFLESGQNALGSVQDIPAYAQRLGLTPEEARVALERFAEAKDRTAPSFDEMASAAGDTSREQKVKNLFRKVYRDLKTPASALQTSQAPENPEETVLDDEYTLPSVKLKERIERRQRQAEAEIRDLVEVGEQWDRAARAPRYSYEWFRLMMELELREERETLEQAGSLRLNFDKVELETPGGKTLVLTRPGRPIPAYLEDLSDITLLIHFGDESKSVLLEAMSVKSFTLRAKLRKKAQLDGLNLAQATGATLEVKSRTFLFKELYDAFMNLGNASCWADGHDLHARLPENIEFVFGPPGTGKTTWLARNVLAPRLREETRLRILCLTPTNKAADVLTQSLRRELSPEEAEKCLLRFGTTNDEDLEQAGIYRERTFDIHAHPVNVTITTMARVPYDYFLLQEGKREPLSAMHWDYVVIDEASMIHLPWMVYALYKLKPKKFIIAGDPFQIQPIARLDDWKDENIYTLTGLKDFTTPITTPHPYPVQSLDTQYRSVPAIGELVSRFTYGGLLRHHRSAEPPREILLKNGQTLRPLTLIKFPVKGYESIYKAKKMQGGSAYHIYSALFVKEFVQELAESLPAKEECTIGVISPYKVQAKLLARLLETLELPGNIRISADTVHSFQGDSCDIIIALLNPPAYISGSPQMFLNKQNILNVSISRARNFLIILMPDDATKNVEMLEKVKKIEELCAKIGCITHSAQDLEERMLGKRTWLEENSFSTSHQSVNVYTRPEKYYEVRSEDLSIDVQIVPKGE